MIKNKIKQLLAYANISQPQASKCLKTSLQNLNKKINRETLRTEDLIRLADVTGTELAFVKDNDIVVKFSTKDITH